MAGDEVGGEERLGVDRVVVEGPTAMLREPSTEEMSTPGAAAAVVVTGNAGGTTTRLALETAT